MQVRSAREKERRKCAKNAQRQLIICLILCPSGHDIGVCFASRCTSKIRQVKSWVMQQVACHYVIELQNFLDTFNESQRNIKYGSARYRIDSTFPLYNGKSFNHLIFINLPLMYGFANLILLQSLSRKCCNGMVDS